MKYKKITFPEDGKPHNNIIEWWYFNGHLKDKEGKAYFFMDCLFKADVAKVNIPFLKVIPVNTLYFHHHLLSDVEAKKTTSHTFPFVVISKDSFSKPFFFVNYTLPSLAGYVNYEIQELDEFKYRVKSDTFDLILESKKKPLLEGGKGFLELNSRITYYYSLTNMETKGHIIADGKSIEVQGKSWMDHQWADAPYSNDKWTWFSIQLDNGTELICFEYDDYKEKDYLLSMIDKDGKVIHITKDIDIIPLNDSWESQQTGAKYELSWKISIPSENIELKTKPILKDQEMIFGPINYWEGGIDVEGTINNKNVTGKGFMELVGVPTTKQLISKYELYIDDVISEKLSLVKKGFGHLKNKTLDILFE